MNFAYFLAMFTESVENKIEDTMGRLTRLIKCITGEAQEMIKHFINNKPEQGYRNAMELVRRQYGNPHRLLAAYRMEIKHMSPIKAPQVKQLRFPGMHSSHLQCVPVPSVLEMNCQLGQNHINDLRCI